MTEAEAVAHARTWLESKFPAQPWQTRGYADLFATEVVAIMNVEYPTGMGGFTEDIAQATGVS